MTLVFGYGSLVDGPVRPAVLPGWRRTWGVAMDNAVDLPGYKHYEVPGTGERPAVMVAFLDVSPDPTAEVPGVVLEVSDQEVAALDRRERNYARVEVETSAGPAVTFAGRAESRVRVARGLAEERCVVQRAYLEAVRNGFEALEPGGAARFDATTGPLPGLVVDLIRVDHPQRLRHRR
jgi:hypothetical protein